MVSWGWVLIALVGGVFIGMFLIALMIVNDFHEENDQNRQK